MKKGINPKAKAILDDILGTAASDEYSKQHQEEIDYDKEHANKK